MFEATRGSSVEPLRALVAFDTVSHQSYLALIDYLERVLAPLGARLERIPDKSGQKANLLASFGPSDTAGYILSGHTDVVPVDGQTWASDPFVQMGRHRSAVRTKLQFAAFAWTAAFSGLTKTSFAGGSYKLSGFHRWLCGVNA